MSRVRAFCMCIHPEGMLGSISVRVGLLSMTLLLGRLTIRGRLTFDETRPARGFQTTVLAAAAMVVLGRDDGDPLSGGELVAGTPTRPFPGVAVIRLVGDRTSPYVTIESDTGNRAHRVAAGPKVLLALGKVSLHGRGLHSFTFQLNVSAFCGIGGAFRGGLGGV